jgi:hypothetical protein
MHNITLNIKNDQLAKQVVWWLEHFKDEGLEIVSVEDLKDPTALQGTPHETSVPFEDDVAHAESAPVAKPRKSLRGSLKQYAHPERMAREQTAWADAVSDAP